MATSSGSRRRRKTWRRTKRTTGTATRRRRAPPTAGAVVWKTPRDMGRGFSTPRLMRTAGGRLDLVLNGPLGCVGYDPDKGKVRWQCKRSDPNDLMRFGEPLPVNDGEMMFVLSGR